METAVSTPDFKDGLVAGDPTVFSPPFPLLPMSVVPLAGVEAPRKLHGLAHVRRTSSCQTGPENNIAPPAVCPGLELRQGLTFHKPSLLAERATKWSGPCLTLGPIVRVFA
jgi:hypothetical protein